MEVTTFDFGDVCLGTIEDENTTVNAQGVVTFGRKAMLQLAQDASGRLDRLKDLEPGFVGFVGADGLELNDRDFRAIAALPGLRHVDFDNSNISNEQVALFCFEGVRGLNIGAEGVGDEVMPAVASVSTLEHLFLSASSVGDAGLAAIEGHAMLDDLSLQKTAVTPACAATLASLPALETLHIDGANDDVVVAAARPHSNWFTFREAVLSESGVTALTKCVELEMLGITRSKPTSAALRLLGEVTCLQGLLLGDSNVDDESLAHGLSGLRALTFLVLNDTAAGDRCAAALGELPALATLHMARTSITNQGLKGLGRSRSVSYLSLSETAITDEGLASLAPVSSLETVETDGTAVTEAGRTLLTQLPKPFALG